MHQNISREDRRRVRRSAQLRRAIGTLDPGGLLNILHAVKEAGAGFRLIGEPTVDTTSQFAEVIIAVLGIAASW